MSELSATTVHMRTYTLAMQVLSRVEVRLPTKRAPGWVLREARYSPAAKIPTRYALQASLQIFARGMRTYALAMQVLSRLEVRLPTKRAPNRVLFLLAGVARFELTNKGVKVLCLTAWRYPYADYGIIPQKQIIVNSKVKLFKRLCILDKAVFSRYNI